MGVAMKNPHLLLCPQVFNNTHLGSWRVHAEFHPFWSKCLTMMRRHTYILTKQNIYIKVCWQILLLWSRSYSEVPFWGGHFFALHTNGKSFSQEGSHPCCSQSQFVYAFHVLNLSLQGFVWPKYNFWPVFGMT